MKYYNPKNFTMQKATKKAGSSSSNYRWPERTKDAAIKELEIFVRKSGEYPYIHEQSKHCVEVHSICKHGISRAGLVASAVDIEDPDGPWQNDESWDGDLCPICDVEECHHCGTMQDLACPRCHSRIKIELSQEEAISVYVEGRNIFEETRCPKCGSGIMVSGPEPWKMIRRMPYFQKGDR